MEIVKTIILKKQVVSLEKPLIMAIVNITPDSFFEGSRALSEADIVSNVGRAISEGADIIDIGGYSTRPGAAHVSEDDEWQRIDFALNTICKNYPDIPISVDTFRSEIAYKSVKTYGIDVINDISGGSIDEKMFDTVAHLGVPYILMHTRGTPSTMMNMTDYDDVVSDVLKYFAQKISLLRSAGFKSDIIIDLGFGFAKTLEQNYTLLAAQKVFECFELPILTGISRKSMINKVLGTTPQEALNGTTVLNTLALLNGANILRVHDVKEAVEAVKLVDFYKRSTQSD